MATAESSARARAQGAAVLSRARASTVARKTPILAWAGLAVVMVGALALRLWGVKTGLPYVYNIDEAGHFVPKAVAMFAPGASLDPHYFVNPPGLTYVLHALFAVWFGGGHAVLREYATHPDRVFLLARVLVALLGAGAVWLLYLLGARLFGRAAGLLAAAIEAVAFLPVFYGHFALNDAATLLPLTLSLFGSAGVMRHGRRRDYALAGAGLGLACAGKYTAGIAALPLAAAAAGAYLGGPAPSGRRTLAGLALAAGCALGAFLIANPYALLDFQRFRSELAHQSSLSAEAQGKLGAPKQGGFAYYLWVLTWGLGWAPALAALAGAAAISRRHPRVAWLLVPAPIAFLVFMGLQDRYFGRWLLPIFPFLCVLAAYAAIAAVRLLAAGRRLVAPLAGALVVALMLGQGLLYSIHDDAVLARADTRNLTRAWMVARVPRGARIVLEPVVLSSWLGEAPVASSPHRWQKYPSLEAVIAPNGAFAPGTRHPVALEDYETTLSPALIGWYEQRGYCWAITGSTESGRALSDPAAAPLAAAYYRALAQSARVAYSVSPYAPKASAPAFSFDWTFDYYPLAYARPGPVMTVYRLTGGACKRSR